MEDTKQLIEDLKKAYNDYFEKRGDPGKITVEEIEREIEFINKELENPNSEFTSEELNLYLKALKNGNLFT